MRRYDGITEVSFPNPRRVSPSGVRPDALAFLDLERGDTSLTTETVWSDSSESSSRSH